MTSTKAIEIIYETARKRMSAVKASGYVGEIMTFILARMTNEGPFSNERFEALLEEEAIFHQNCKDDVA